MTHIATHTAPAWGDKANFLIRANLSSCSMPGRFEQLWARRIGPTKFEICCIPFFTYGVALGDKVETDATFTITHIIEKTGHQNLRIAIAIEDKQSILHELLHDWAIARGLVHEWYSAGYVAMDLAPGEGSSVNLRTLEDLRDDGSISFEIDT